MHILVHDMVIMSIVWKLCCRKGLKGIYKILWKLKVKYMAN